MICVALLDQPNFNIAYAKKGEHVVGVIIAVYEGSFNHHQQARLLSEQRRFAGHILPQQLLIQVGAAALSLSYLRIMRIATVSSCRRQGIGQGLLTFIQSNSASVDLLGSSFSTSNEVMDFWQAAGFETVHLGHKLSAVSASYSQLVLKPKNEKSMTVVQQARDHFSVDFSYRLLSEYQQLESVIVAKLCWGLKFSIQTNDDFQAHRYVNQQLGLVNCQAALARHALCYYAEHDCSERFTVQDDLVIRRLLLNQSFDEIASALQLTGRKHIERQLRQWFSCLLPVKK